VARAAVPARRARRVLRADALRRGRALQDHRPPVGRVRRGVTRPVGRAHTAVGRRLAAHSRRPVRRAPGRAGAGPDASRRGRHRSGAHAPGRPAGADARRRGRVARRRARHPAVARLTGVRRVGRDPGGARGQGDARPQPVPRRGEGPVACCSAASASSPSGSNAASGVPSSRRRPCARRDRRRRACVVGWGTPGSRCPRTGTSSTTRSSSGSRC
jgi:hypothetical protein